MDITYPTLNSVAERLQWAMDLRDLKQAPLAEAVGTSQTTVQKLLSGKSQTSKFLPAMARHMEIDFEWLESGQLSMHAPNVVREIGALYPPQVQMGTFAPWDDSTPLEDDEVELPLFKEIELSSGHGRTCVQEHTGRKLRFSAATLRNCGVDVNNAAFATNTGNSNHPLILHNSTVGVDKGMTRIVDGELYALDHSGQLRVKFLFRTPGGGLRMHSYNHAEYPDETYAFDDIMEQRIQILGRVFWWSTLRSLRSPPLI